jgi:DNA-binding CsgD family transcriptional regulator
MSDEVEQAFEDELMHIGVLHKSGRYPWGSGENPTQRNKQFLDYVDEMAKKGMSDTEIARGVGISTTQLRVAKKIAKTEQRAAQQSEAYRLKNERGMSNIAIGEKMGLNESSVRALLDPSRVEKNSQLDNTAAMLKEHVDKKGAVDIGTGSELHVGVSRTQLLQAVSLLGEQGYDVQYEKVEQAGTGKNTTVMVLRHPDTDWKAIRNGEHPIGSLASYSEDGGRTFNSIKPPLNVSSKRVEVRYGPDGGADMDGVIQVRRGVQDLSMGNARYAQVRIAVDGSHYLKGMAMYADDLPDGVDLRFNTNKSKTDNKLDAMKKMKDDADNPFGAVVRQIQDHPGPNGKPISAMNIVNEEGAWNDWSKNLSSQVLSKQSTVLAKKQLGLRLTEKQQELDEIMNLNNPEVKRHLLKAISDDLDSSAVHLKAAALPRQRTQVILPINSLKETEVYAPNFRNGEKVVLVRYPHGGIFEIPELTVNNNNKEAKSIIPGAKDAVGIHSKVAGRLSGADFDGDTVLVIPNNNRSIKTASPLKELKGFDPQAAYPAYEGMPKMSARTKQLKMGDVSNLITDMTIQGAPHHEIARAVRHSMVVIDAEKHNLNWRQSAKDNGISELKTRYQKGPNSGAETLISRASSRAVVAKRQDRRASDGGWIDPVTGERRYTPTGESYTDKNGKLVVKTQNSTKMAEARNAYDLFDGDRTPTTMEVAYADYANNLKSMANGARKEILATKPSQWSPSAKKVYASEVAALNAKLNIAKKNAPLERQAQLLAAAKIKAQRDANPSMDHAEVKKLRNVAITEARARTGAGKEQIKITADEWKAIQAGAISPSKLKDILDNSDSDTLKALATPRDRPVMTASKTSRAKAMSASGFTAAEIADALGVSVSTLHTVLGGE